MTKKSAAAMRRELIDRIQTEGAQAAYEALVAVARDPKAASPARATAGSALFRAAGLLNAKPEDFIDKQPSEMSYDELVRAAEALEAEGEGGDNAERAGVFD